MTLLFAFLKERVIQRLKVRKVCLFICPIQSENSTPVPRKNTVVPSKNGCPRDNRGREVRISSQFYYIVN